MKIKSIVLAQEVLFLVQTLDLSQSEKNTFTIWFLDSAEYHPSAATLAKRSNIRRQTVDDHLKKLTKVGAIVPGKKQKLGMQWKNTYTLGPIFSEILGQNTFTAPTEAAPKTNYSANVCLKHLPKIIEVIDYLDGFIESNKWTVKGKGRHKIMTRVREELSLIQTKISKKDLTHIDHKIMNLIDRDDSKDACVSKYIKMVESMAFESQIAFNPPSLPVFSRPKPGQKWEAQTQPKPIEKVPLTLTAPLAEMTTKIMEYAPNDKDVKAFIGRTKETTELTTNDIECLNGFFKLANEVDQNRKAL